jgi:hypothetical protein
MVSPLELAEIDDAKLASTTEGRPGTPYAILISDKAMAVIAAVAI